MSAPTVDETTRLDPDLADDLRPECNVPGCDSVAVWAWIQTGPCPCKNVSLLCQLHHDHYARGLDHSIAAVCAHCRALCVPWRLWVRIERI